ncbi:hypothetical protein JCM8097_005327 [Rhodosporidiobolus ruineniae]
MELPPTSLSLPKALPFPLTIHRIHATKGTTVDKTQHLLSYSYQPPSTAEDAAPERAVRVWESPVHGEVVRWEVREGDQVTTSRQAVVQIKEPCTHDVQLHGLCALCGKDLNATDYTGFSDTSRATISMVHDVGGLTVSMDEAHRLESATTSRLLNAKKLSLIVDLDQTIVHATVDPTVGEWLQDPTNPNYGALEGVGKFRLVDEAPAGKRKRPRREKAEEEDEEGEEEEEEEGCWYYIKMRPGLPSFLRRIAEKYEMHVYTMGTRAYAKEVCRVIDPDGGLFGGRILSRDESGSMTRKSLQRLFPCDTNMVVIIDDRADVWDGSPNLVKVIPYEFFVGIGDINAAFLPKRKDLVPPPISPPAPPPPSSPSPASSSSASAESTPSTLPEGGGNGKKEAEEEHHLPESVASEPTTVSDLLVNSSPTALVSPSLSEASSALAAAVHEVIEARPLEKAQREADEAHHLAHPHAHPQHGRSENGSKSPESPGGAKKVGGEGEGEGEGEGKEEGKEDEMDADELELVIEEEEAVLKDDDRELDRLFDILSTVHGRFFDEHKKKGTADVARIIPHLKSLTLHSCHLVFSGLVALGSRPEDSQYWQLARTFGATCSAELRKGVTHLVANKAGTAKVHSARRARNPPIQIVQPAWLVDCSAHWTRLDEQPYLLEDPESTTPPGSPVRPAMSDGEGEKKGEERKKEADEGEETDIDLDLLAAGAAEGGDDTLDLDLDTAAEPELELDVDWNDAMKEVDDLLNETDDDSDAESVVSAASTSSAPRSRKRARLSTPTEESNGGGVAAGDGAGANGAAADTESPLQKRVKTALSRRSGLKTSLSAATLENAAVAAGTANGDEVAAALAAAGAGRRRPSLDESGGGASQASSSVDSDDEDLLASMAAELEGGWS